MAALLVLGGCPPEGPDGDADADEPGPDAEAEGDAGADAEGETGADADAVEPDGDLEAEPPPLPEPHRPCETGSCWRTTAPLAICRSVTLGEDFGSGRYNVHDYATTLYPEGETTIRLTRTAGAWQPAVLLAELDGTVLSDGAIGLVADGLEVDLERDGRSGDEARVRVRTALARPVSLFVTGWSVIASGFVELLPTDSRYSLSVAQACEVPPVECVVNGRAVGEPACGWLHHVGRRVVPQLLGARAERLDDAAVVAWWSLKEGVLSLANPIVYSNCNFTTGDARIGPLELCPSGRAWQVGLAAVQVPNYPLTAVEATTRSLFPTMTVEEVLAATAVEARVDAATAEAVVASSGDLRRSWLLRTSPVGFTHQVGTVTTECLDSSRSWCFGSGWDETRWYAPSREAALRSIADIRAILDALAP